MKPQAISCPDCNKLDNQKIVPYEKPKPIKRIEELQPLSREHHFGLLLCWKIRTGIKKNIDFERIKKYIDWFWENHLIQHFETEEKYIFPILGNNHPFVKQAKLEHWQLKKLFKDITEPEKSIILIEKKLEKHIRFEERVLFNEIQKIAFSYELEIISKNHSSEFKENWHDNFWID